jgi:hypothetical protein
MPTPKAASDAGPALAISMVRRESPPPSRGNWFRLAATVLLQAAWLAFLAAMVLKR